VGVLVRASRLLVLGWPMRESITTADCAAVRRVTRLTALSLLIFPTVFHVLINGRVAFLKVTRSRDHVGDQSLGRSPNSFPWSRAGWSRGIREVEGSRGRSCDLVT
jgi:hypothetical protein